MTPNHTAFDCTKFVAAVKIIKSPIFLLKFWFKLTRNFFLYFVKYHNKFYSTKNAHIVFLLKNKVVALKEFVSSCFIPPNCWNIFSADLEMCTTCCTGSGSGFRPMSKSCSLAYLWMNQSRNLIPEVREAQLEFPVLLPSKLSASLSPVTKQFNKGSFINDVTQEGGS